MSAQLDSVIKVLTDSGVIAQGKLDHFVPPKAHPKSAEELIAELVKSGHLTTFQAAQVKAGRARSLILGSYTILDKIGAGGMGQVFKAQHRKMERVVAIKMLPASMTKDPAALARFHREVVAAAKLRHPNIVAADDASEANGVHFLVMEFVDGKDLSASVKKDGPFSVSKALNYVLQAARGLEFAHSEGVVHRDIKPANLLVDKKGVVKILDMGLARFDGGLGSAAGAQAELTGTGTIMGTVDYMAPEQAVNTKHADQRADIYSLGITLYYLIAGKAAYGGDTLMEKLLAHREQPIPSLRESQASISPQLEEVFKRMVAKRIEDRYQTMSEVITALESIQSEQTTSTSVPSISTSLDAAAALPLPSIQVTKAISQTKKSQPPPNQLPAEKNTARRGNPPPLKLIAAGLGGFALLAALGLWVVVRDKDGQEVARIKVPEGGSVTVQQPSTPPAAVTKPVASSTPATTPAKTAAPAKPSTTIFDSSVSTTKPRVGGVAYLDDLTEKSWSGYGGLGKRGKYLSGSQIVSKGLNVEHALFTAPLDKVHLAYVEYDLGGRYDLFRATVYLLRIPSSGPQTFRVLGDGKLLWESPPKSTANDETALDVSVRDVQLLRLEVAGKAPFSHPVWLEPRLTLSTPPTAGLRWPLAASKPEDIQRLLDARHEVTVRSSTGGAPLDRKLKIGDTIPSEPTTIVGMDLKTELVPIDDAILAVIAGFTDLEELSFEKGNNSVTSSGLLKLASLQQLRRLDVYHAGSKVDEASGLLQSLPHLEHLYLPYSSESSKKWAQAAAASTSIVEINAYRTGLTEAGLASLEKMSQLKAIDLIDCRQISPAAVERFAALVPGCRIRWGTSNEKKVIEPRTVRSSF